MNPQPHEWIVETGLTQPLQPAEADAPHASIGLPELRLGRPLTGPMTVTRTMGGD
jgi:hypothetical protein